MSIQVPTDDELTKVGKIEGAGFYVWIHADGFEIEDPSGGEGGWYLVGETDQEFTKCLDETITMFSL